MMDENGSIKIMATVTEMREMEQTESARDPDSMMTVPLYKNGKRSTSMSI